MDILSILGVIVGFAAIIGGNYLEGGTLSLFLNLPAAVIVIGGTLGAAMLQTSKEKMQRAINRLRWVLYPPTALDDIGNKKIIDWAREVRKNGLLALENFADNEKDDFARKGLQMLIDGGEPEAIRQTLELDSSLYEQTDLEAARVFDSMGGYAPTIGIIGAVMGLIHVMGNITEPDKLGDGIAVAFVATIYGVGLANLILLPIANKLRSCIRSEVQFRAMTIEGLVAIAEGENPRTIESRLQSFLKARI
jgi:chemotaxis protein MotA